MSGERIKAGQNIYLLDYKVVEHLLSAYELNELGAEGWELVTLTGQKAIFKRFVRRPVE